MAERSGPWPKRSLIGTLTEQEREELLKLGTKVEFPHKAALVRQGDPDNGALYILLDGYTKVTVDTADGNQTVLAIRSRGDLVGEFALLDGGPRTATVTAINTVVAIRIGRSAVNAYLADHPDAHAKVTASLLAKMRTSTERRVEARAWGARERIARLLCELVEQYGEPGDDGVVIALPLSQFELGGLAGAGEATTERVLNEFRHAGMIRTSWRRITVLDAAKLRGLWRGY
ncbi:Crp/Fnr family transcriptional regulator [Actinocorallia sp. A-T 12471]|uniref:Crp/Fnr family transcriptional regulator n=1 Tax=Actinocorallia sp. A-T 12471 TaxID=3089813 RepID=UPI0029CB1DC9|nr:Crp/Fnr family transcriptional regulator [Actinocorallia sp. A-T 12471]MDX6742110.1 Crp/Fnr family transcriptional regulator [Actinocorallia sp. A-T 12471]